MDIKSNFGERLNEILFESKLDIESFAKAVNINFSTIYKCLRKESIPTFANALAIVNYFNCSLDFIFGLSEDDKKYTRTATLPFFARFKEILKINGITRYRLCKEAKFSDQSVDDWYNGKREPSMDNIIKLSKYFDYTLDFLVGRE